MLLPLALDTYALRRDALLSCDLDFSSPQEVK
jgi:hypothetical protein